MSAATTMSGFPRFRAVAEHGVLVEFGDVIGKEVHDQVRRLDSALASKPFDGFIETVPAYTNLLVSFDPIRTDHAAVQAAVSTLLRDESTVLPRGAVHEALVCYDSEFAPDLSEVAHRTGLTIEAVIAAHLTGDYSVFMYGFAPGFAYLAGTPQAIQIPRKPSPVRGIASGSVLIAGPQCLVTTLVMPTGWWIIGRSPTRILRDHDAARPVLFDVGDTVKFKRIDRGSYDAEERRGAR